MSHELRKNPIALDNSSIICIDHVSFIQIYRLFDAPLIDCFRAIVFHSIELFKIFAIVIV